jgi:TolA-binding protein/peroxiredoxin
MRLLLVLLAAGGLLPAQTGSDARISTEFQAMLERASPAGEAREADEATARARADRFRQELEGFLTRWTGHADELDSGRVVLGKALSMGGRPAEAVPLFRSYLAAHPGAAESEDVELSLGTSLLDSSSWGDAVEVFRRFLEGHPESDHQHVALYYQAIGLWRLGAADGAIANLRRVLSSGAQDPLVGDAALKSIEYLRDLGRVEQAREVLAETRSQSEDPDAPFLLALQEQLDWIGRPAPGLVDLVASLNGDAPKLADLSGRTVVVSFFADKYEPCAIELENISRLARERGDGVVFIGLTKYYRPLDKVPADRQNEMLGAYLKERGVAFPVAVASSFENLRNYGVRGVPHTVVIGPDGTVRYVKYGASRQDAQGVGLLSGAISRAVGG